MALLGSLTDGNTWFYLLISQPSVSEIQQKNSTAFKLIDYPILEITVLCCDVVERTELQVNTKSSHTGVQLQCQDVNKCGKCNAILFNTKYEYGQ